MAVIYAHDGDMVIVLHHGTEHEFQVIVEGDNEEGQIGFEYSPDICKACGERHGDIYKTATGEKLCPGCVNRGLVYQVMRDILYDIHRHNPNLAIVVDALNDDDIAMAKGTGQFVDSLSNGYDWLRSIDAPERDAWFEDVIGAIWRNAFANVPQ